MLVFWGTSSQCSSTQADAAQTGESSSATASGSVHSDDSASDSKSEHDDTPYAFESPAPTKKYSAWIKAKWQEAKREWKEQDGGKLPDLVDRCELHEVAAKHPEDMIAAGQLFANPFHLLNHFEDEGIVGWMQPEWLKWRLKVLGGKYEALDTAEERNEVMGWLECVHKTPVWTVKLRMFQNRKIWALLRRRLPSLFTGPDAVALVSDTLSKEGAFVMVLGALIPSLSSDLQRLNGQMETGAKLYEVYSGMPAFLDALRLGIKRQSRDPVETYLKSIEFGQRPDTIHRGC